VSPACWVGSARFKRRELAGCCSRPHASRHSASVSLSVLIDDCARRSRWSTVAQPHLSTYTLPPPPRTPAGIAPTWPAARGTGSLISAVPSAMSVLLDTSGACARAGTVVSGRGSADLARGDRGTGRAARRDGTQTFTARPRPRSTPRPGAPPAGATRPRCWWPDLECAGVCVG
jgi:hypothetical protein